jgi:hypothetical protein
MKFVNMHACGHTDQARLARLKPPYMLQAVMLNWGISYEQLL